MRTQTARVVAAIEGECFAHGTTVVAILEGMTSRGITVVSKDETLLTRRACATKALQELPSKIAPDDEAESTALVRVIPVGNEVARMALAQYDGALALLCVTVIDGAPDADLLLQEFPGTHPGVQMQLWALVLHEGTMVWALVQIQAVISPHLHLPFNE